MSRKYNRYMKVFRIVVVMCVLSFGMPFTLIQAQHAIAERGNMSLSNNYQTNSFLEIVIDKVEINERPRLEAIQLIANKANLRVTYDVEIPALMDRVSFELSNITVQDALWAVLDNSGVRYAISRNGQLALFPYEIQPAVQIIQNGSITGRVTDARNGDPLTGATIYIESISRGTLPDDDGYYKLEGIPAGEYTIVASFLGYRRITRDITIVAGEELVLNFELQPSSATLQEVEVVSTGYQDIPRERATGSFVLLNEEAINQRVSTNILDRIENISPGLIFNRSAEDIDPISIRGRSTINANARPLIVVDNFPYDGELENINPNDVERITILKDAAAASIWGAQAANGVIVITTRRGNFDMTPVISFTSNTTVGEKPDLFYSDRMSSSDMVDIEVAMFNAGRFTARENSVTRPYLSEVVELMIRHRDGHISIDQLNSRLDYLRMQDVRVDMDKYYYQPSLNQQYALNIRGGSNTQRYIFSAGYDFNEPNRIGEKSHRFTLNGSHTWRLIENKLEITTGVGFVRSASYWDRAQFETTSYLRPYSRFVDDQGNPLPIYGWGNYRHDFLAEQESNGLLNWLYYPLLEVGAEDRNVQVNDYRVNTSISYEILPQLRASVYYQYWQNTNINKHNRPLESFYTRDLINQYTQVSANGQLTFPIPRGGIMDYGLTSGNSHQIRGLINFENTWNERNQVVALGGWELKSYESGGRSARYYGYNEKYGTSVNVDHVTRFPLYHYNLSTNVIPGSSTIHTGITENFVSFFINASYTLDQKYTITGSARNDASNLFGVRTNQKWSPLWSIGGSWLVSDESFYPENFFLDYLKVRLTYGYNGNIDRSVSAYTIATRTAPGNGSYPQLIGHTNVSAISRPPNPDLTWEKVGNTNLGLEFQAFDGVIRGNIDFYNKKSTDLIGDIYMPRQTGVGSFRGNFADMKTSGMDLHLTTRNLNKSMKWETTFLFSLVNNEVTKYEFNSSVSNYVTPLFIVPLAGYPLHSYYAYEWAGLDPQTGEPMGYLNGEPSKNYTAIVQSYTPETIQYIGPSRPTKFGSVINSFAWKNVTFSATIAYRLGYYIKRETLNYSSLLTNFIQTHGDYARRWQQPGDELNTNVPSMPSNFILPPNRIAFELNNASHYIRGDHIRMQDLRIGYKLPSKATTRLSIRSAEFYAYASNFGIIWSLSDYNKDPDYQLLRPERKLSFGIQVTL